MSNQYPQYRGHKPPPPGRGNPVLVISLIITGCLTVVIIMAVALYFGFKAPLDSGIRATADGVTKVVRAQKCRVIMLAIHKYMDSNKHMPNSVSTDVQGNVMHSWRAEVLPYFENGPIHIDLKKPWNDPDNQIEFSNINLLYCNSLGPKRNETNYVAVVGDDTVITGDKRIDFRDIVDGSGKNGRHS